MGCTELRKTIHILKKNKALLCLCHLPSWLWIPFLAGQGAVCSRCILILSSQCPAVCCAKRGGGGHWSTKRDSWKTRRDTCVSSCTTWCFPINNNADPHFIRFSGRSAVSYCFTGDVVLISKKLEFWDYVTGKWRIRREKCGNTYPGTMGMLPPSVRRLPSHQPALWGDRLGCLCISCMRKEKMRRVSSRLLSFIYWAKFFNYRHLLGAFLSSWRIWSTLGW